MSLYVKNCSFCKQEFKGKLGNEVCENIECITASKYRCKKILKCLHFCGLACTSTKCLCLVSECYNSSSLVKCFEVNCCFCLDALSDFPLCLSDCGHLFHHKCISQLLHSNSLKGGDKVKLSFLKCPICTIPLSLNLHRDLQIIIEYYHSLQTKLQNAIYQIIDTEQLEIRIEVKDPQSIYYDKPFEFAESQTVFYLCFKCEEPYFGGIRSCEIEDIEDNQIVELKERLCMNCVDSNSIFGELDCNIHGRLNIMFKCRYCCNQSSHFCFGTTHFCEDCHLKQLAHMSLTSTKLSELPKCNESECYLKGNHSPNGTEYAFGCGLCLSFQK